MGSWIHLADNSGRITVTMGGRTQGKTLETLGAQARAKAAGAPVPPAIVQSEDENGTVPLDMSNGRQ